MIDDRADDYIMPKDKRPVLQENRTERVLFLGDVAGKYVVELQRWNDTRMQWEPCVVTTFNAWVEHWKDWGAA